MSAENNFVCVAADVDVKLSSEFRASSYSSVENSNEEHHTIHGNAKLKNIESDSMLNETSEEEENLTVIQSDLAAQAVNSNYINNDIYGVDARDDVNGTTALSEEEIEKKFQELDLAFRTDIMTLQKRLIIRKRLRDQAEINIDKEISFMKAKLNSLRYLCIDSESLEQLTDLRKHLDIILATANYLSGVAEAYGFVLNEEKMSGAVSIIVKQIESIERIQNEMSKSPDSPNSNGRIVLIFPSTEDDRHEERLLRRRSVAALALNGSAKRRASIASVPRNLNLMDDTSGSQPCSTQSLSSIRSVGTPARKTSSSQAKSSSPVPAGDQQRVRDKSYAIRCRKESRMGEDRYGMKFVPEFTDDSHSSAHGNDDLFISSDEEATVEGNVNSQMAIRRISGSFENRMRTNSIASETLNVIDCLRKVIKWNIFLLRNSRFQFPENVQQYVPFLITWYIIVLVMTIFTSGFFVGFSRCCNSQQLYFYTIIFTTVISWITAIKLMLRYRPLRVASLIVIAVFVYRFICTVHDEGLYVALKNLGIEIRIHYPTDAPPV